MLKNILDAKQTLKLISLWPPYLFAGISVRSVSSDFLEISVQMKQKFYNTNYVGTHFGGSLYSMCDPWFMFILLEHLGNDYIVWDKGASIDFKSPGKGLVYADFKLSESEILRVKGIADEQRKCEPEYEVNVYGQSGQVVARVHKKLYIKRKDKINKKN